MSSLICPSCAELRPGGASCASCGSALVSLSEPVLDEFVRVRLRRRIETWREQEVVDLATAARLLATLEAAVDAQPLRPPPGPASVLEKWADELAASAQRLAAWRPGWGSAFFLSLEEAARAEREASARHGSRAATDEDDDEGGLGLALGSGNALFGQGVTGALGGGLEALVALDEADGAQGREALKLHEYVWWFLGALLVLGGSIMGVREAWRALGGVPRQLIVTGALFTYHASFTGLGVFLARRSLSVGRVLASIGLALLPVVFVALAALVALAPSVGVPCALFVAALSQFTLRPAGRLLHGTSPVALAWALLPSLLAELPLPGLEEAPWLRVLCSFAGVAALGVSLWRSERAGKGLAPLVSAGSALYGALALALFAVASGSEGFDALAPGSPTFAGMALWAVALAGTVAAAAMQGSVRQAYPRMAPAVEVLAHAAVATGVLAGVLSAFSVDPGSDPSVDLVSAFIPAAGALAFFLLRPGRRSLVHLGVLAATILGFLLARLQAPADVAWWFVGPAAVASALLLIGPRPFVRGMSTPLLVWGFLLSLAAMPVVWLATTAWGQGSLWPRVVTGALIAVAAHVSAGQKLAPLHYLGGIALFFGSLAAVAAFPWLASPWSTQTVFAIAGALYGLAALGYQLWVRRHGGSMQLSPLDDLSLASAALGVILFSGWSAASWPEALLSTSGRFADAVLRCAPTALAALLALMRVTRDRSRLVSFLAASGLALTVVQFCVLTRDPNAPSSVALVPSALVLGFALIASLRGRGLMADPGLVVPRGRQILGFIRLPLHETGRPLFTDGFASAALGLVLVSVGGLVAWTFAPSELERSWSLLAGGLLVAGALLAFFTRGFVAWRLRGSVVSLAAGGLFITLVAVVNRAGRPLPPDVVAWRLPLIGIGVWGLALVARRFGPWLARKLEAEPHGRFYHWVPHSGVAALAVVLVTGTFGLVAPGLSRALAVVPPLMPLGAALLLWLLAASFRARRLVWLSLLLGLPGVALWAAQQALVGPGLTALVPPSSQWVRTAALSTLSGGWLDSSAWLPPGATVFLLWQRAFAGIAAAGLAYAGVALVQAHVSARLAWLRRLLSWVPEESREWHEHTLGAFADPVLQELRSWSVTAVLLVCAAAFFQPGLSSAALTLATGAVLFLGRARSLGRPVLGVSLLLLVHALAHREPVVAVWPGPVLALLGLAVVVLGPWVARLRGLNEERTRVHAQFAALLYALAGTVYALGARGSTAPSMAVPRLVFHALLRLDGRWMLSVAFPVTAALVATTLLVGSFQWKGAMASLGAALGSVLAGFTVLCGLSDALLAHAGGSSDPSPSYSSLLAGSGAALALGASGSAALLHAAVSWLRSRRGDVALGLVLGRDVWLVGCGGLLGAMAVLGQSPGTEVLPLAVAAIGLAVAVALHCAWTLHTGRHVYFVQVAVVGVYALVRALYATRLRPEHDALFALALGFVLVGVTVLARRAGIPPVANATRRFAAVLPLLMWWILPAEATHQAALLAGGSGVLYAAIGAVEQSRWFGSLAAAACNLALLISALAFGLDGVEIYLAPLGLLLIMLGQLFGSSLPQAARNAVRVLGGVLLYVPSAAKLSLQVGLASDGTYALIFGAACLLGVAAGMVLHIRAYLALGTLFLTLDVVANLVHAGLRDHRIGFMVMTLTGLSIVTGRIWVTLRRQQFELWMRHVRVQLRGWD